MPDLSSLLNGRPAPGAPGGRVERAQPGRTGSDVVATVALGDRVTFVGRLRGAPARPSAGWAATPAPVRGRAIAADRPPRRGQQGGAGPPRHARDRQAARRGARRGPGDRRHLRLLPRRGPAPVRPDGPERDARQAALHVPRRRSAWPPIITAGNFPVAVPSWYLVPALLCGNAVVWKPAEYAPAIGRRARAPVLHGGLPDGVLHARAGRRRRRPFAGLEAALDRRAGRQGRLHRLDRGRARIGELCGRHLQSPCLELGGKNPLVVMDDADLDLAVEGALFSGFGTAGQRCTSLGTAIVHDVGPRRVPRAARRARSRQAPIGDPTQDVLYGPMISERFLERFEDECARARPRPPRAARLDRRRADHAPRTRARASSATTPSAACFCHPTIVGGVRADDELATTETFGPIVGVARVRRLGRGDRAGQRPRLRALVRDLHDATRRRVPVPRAASAPGMVASTTRPPAPRRTCRSAATAARATARASPGIWVLDQFTRWQAMNWDYSGRLQKAQMDVAEIAPTSTSASTAERHLNGRRRATPDAPSLVGGAAPSPPRARRRRAGLCRRGRRLRRPRPELGTAAGVPTTRTSPPAVPARRAAAARLTLLATRTLPAPVQLPALAGAGAASSPPAASTPPTRRSRTSCASPRAPRAGRRAAGGGPRRGAAALGGRSTCSAAAPRGPDRRDHVAGAAGAPAAGRLPAASDSRA